MPARPQAQQSIDTLRTLAMDAVEAAGSGHPGTPMALAPVAYVLWNEVLNYDPAQPAWPARDRFVLSCGHASMLLYGLIHLAGVRATDAHGTPLDRAALTLDDLRRFRQLDSPCAGHPEYGHTAGIETTTGPLGQGLGNSVGMAIAARWLAARYNRPGHKVLGHDVYALCSDGDLMEGVAGEAASLAGHLGLSNLCWIYDQNRITIEGHTDLAFSEDVARRFEGLGWHTRRVAEANDLDDLAAAFAEFRLTGDRPTLVMVESVIAWGAPNKANTAAAHGSPLGAEEIRRTKAFYGWPPDAQFLVPDAVREDFAAGLGRRGGAAYAEWHTAWKAYQSAYPELAAEVAGLLRGALPEHWDADLPVFGPEVRSATRVTSGKVLNRAAQAVPWLLGGAADLAPSTKTLLEFTGAETFTASQPAGRNFHFGIREHAMAAAANGMALSGLRPYVATFFVFSDYLRPALRLSALMRQPVLYIFTHDSIGLGEDGPTHQPVEQLAACRAIPGLIVLRPGDANEVREAYRVALESTDAPVALVLTRQDVPTLERPPLAPADGLRRGAYVLAQSADGLPELILIGTGSELDLCLQAYQTLSAEGVRVRLVSLPSWELFDQQTPAYQEEVLPSACAARIAVEAGVKQGWERYLGAKGEFVGLETFGASAPYEQLYAHFGLTTARILEVARRLLAD